MITEETHTNQDLLTLLDEPFQLTEAQKAQFRRDGFIKLKDILSREILDHYGPEITRQVLALNGKAKPMSERTTYEKAFLQVGNLWTKSAVAREFVFGKRLAQIAAELMGVRGVRLYHDQALYKEPGGGITPWHADQYYWPLGTDNTVTVWVPLQETPIELGPLSFSIGSHAFEFGRNLEISDESETKLQRSLKDQNYPLEESPYDLGEVSYHYGWTFHRAGPNNSDRHRAVMTIIYFEDGARMVEPKTKGQRNDHAVLFPEIKPGETVATSLTPLLYQG